MSTSDSIIRITFLLTQSLESPGGGGRFFPIAKALTNKGFKVTLIALHHDYANLEINQFVKDGVVIKYVGQMHVHKSANGKTYFKPWKLLWVTAVSTIRLTWATLRTPCDIVQICKAQPMNGISAWVTHLLKRTPVFLDGDDLEAVNNRFSSQWQQKIVTRFEDWIPSFVKGITVNSSYIKNHFVTLGYPHEQIKFVPNGVDRELFNIINLPEFKDHVSILRQALQIETNTHVITYIGSISLVCHAIDLLLNAFVIIQQQIPNVALLIVGAGEDLNDLKRLACQLGIEDATHFLGYIPKKDIPFYYGLANVTVDPHRNSIADESSFPLKLVESIACGIPCVTTDIGDRKAMVGESGLAIPPNDSLAIANGLIAILNQPELVAKMRQATLMMRNQLWWDIRVDSFIDLYSSPIDIPIENAPDY